MSCHISTDDGYLKTIPYISGIYDWEIGMEVELYHSEEKWTATYIIVKKEVDVNLPQLNPTIKIELARKKDSKKIYDADLNPSDQLSKTVRKEIDLEIMDVLAKLIEEERTKAKEHHAAIEKEKNKLQTIDKVEILMKYLKEYNRDIL